VGRTGEMEKKKTLLCNNENQQQDKIKSLNPQGERKMRICFLFWSKKNRE
jgi:hypothetical protein